MSFLVFARKEEGGGRRRSRSKFEICSAADLSIWEREGGRRKAYEPDNDLFEKQYNGLSPELEEDETKESEKDEEDGRGSCGVVPFS